MKIRIAIPIVIGLALALSSVIIAVPSKNVFAQGADNHVIIPSHDNQVVTTIDSDIATHTIHHGGDIIHGGHGADIIVDLTGVNGVGGNGDELIIAGHVLART